LRVEVHKASIDALMPAWAELFEADEAATPFASPQWARAWWPHWSGIAEPWVVVVSEGSQVAGLAPLVMRRRGPFRVLSELGRHPANYWDIVARPALRDPVTRAVVAELTRRSSEWDALVLACLPTGSPTPGGLARSPMKVHARTPVPYPGIELPGSFDEYLGRLNSKRRKDLRRHLRRLDSGELELRAITEPDGLQRTVDRWHSLRLRWWRERGRTINPEHATDRFRDFVADLVALLVPSGLAEVWEFWREGAVVGVEISLTDRQSHYAWLDGYDPDASELGLGKIAVAHGIRTSIEVGRKYFDFMVGDEAYKYWYGAEDRYCRWLMCTSGRPRSRAARGANALVERFRWD
jgi:CelD/BcsL family acetyltransferase involved in cellulose biosynthesis